MKHSHYIALACFGLSLCTVTGSAQGIEINQDLIVAAPVTIS